MSILRNMKNKEFVKWQIVAINGNNVNRKND